MVSYKEAGHANPFWCMVLLEKVQDRLLCRVTMEGIARQYRTGQYRRVRDNAKKWHDRAGPSRTRQENTEHDTAGHLRVWYNGVGAVQGRAKMESFRQVRAVQGRPKTNKIRQMFVAHNMSEQYSHLLLKYVYTIKTWSLSKTYAKIRN